jgi:glycerol-3-phosphate acyltransferase PlsY
MNELISSLSFAMTTNLLIAVLLGYLIGSTPIAMLISKRQGFNIFETGTGLPGAANVFRSVGKKSGVIVGYSDVTKGILTVITSQKLGINNELILIPGLAALLGHWRSIFTNFKGGDGLAALIGITIASLPTIGFPIMLIAATVAATSRLKKKHASLWGGFFAYTLLIASAIIYPENIIMIIGLICLGLLVLFHGMRGHKQRKAELLLSQ